MDQLGERFQTLGADIVVFAPRLLGALAFLALGLLVAHLLDRALRVLCRRLRLDDSAAGRRLSQLFALAGLSAAPSVALRWLVRWTVLIIALAQAVRFLQLDSVANVIDRLVGIAPVLIVVLAVLFIGATLGERLAQAAQNAAARGGTVPPTIAAAAVRISVLATAATLALEAAGVTASLPVIILAICLAGAIVLVVAGLITGARAWLENLLAAPYVEEHYIEGQMVEFRRERAQIRSIGLLATVIRTGDGTDHTMPNALFLREAI